MAESPLTLSWDITFDEAIAAAVAREVVLPEIYYGELQGIARQLAFSIAGVASLDQLQAVKDSLDAAMKKGLSFNQWRKQAAVLELGLPKHRLDNIFRTNLQGNYQSGKWESFLRNELALPYLNYSAINDSRVRPSHWALNGVIRPVGDPFWASHAPPNGYRCRCTLIPLSKSEALAQSGPNEGLYKVPWMDNGRIAEPDPGWNYSPRERLQGVESAIKSKSGKVSGVMLNILIEKIKNNEPDQA